MEEFFETNAKYAGNEEGNSEKADGTLIIRKMQLAKVLQRRQTRSLDAIKEGEVET